MQNVSVQVSELGYRYANRDVPAIQDVTLRFDQGQVVLIVGESGSGKTTLFRCINGLIPQSYRNGILTGVVQIGKDPIAGLRLAQLARRIGTVLQDPEKQMVSAQVRSDIAFGLENTGVPRDEIIARVTGVARRLNIEHLLERATHSLSGGERQKVAIAGVLVMRPQVLLFDEPLASLDPRSAREVLGLFRTLADDGVCVVMVEHRVRAALQAKPDQCIEMAQGAVIFQGDAHAFDEWRTQTRAPVAVPPPVPRRADTPPLLALREVTFAYPDKPATLKNVSLQVYPGDVVALMGPNGAGKSTLSKMAIGILRPERGEVLLNQLPTANLSVAQMARQVGYVFQHPSSMLFANSLREELSFGPHNIGLDEATIAQAMQDALTQVHLAEQPLDRSPFALSYGQQKRVAIASVLAMQPQLLFLDEPTAGLDDATAALLMAQLLAEYRRQARLQAMVLITHDVALARQYANRLIVLAEGAIVADGAPDVVLADTALMEHCHLQ